MIVVSKHHYSGEAGGMMVGILHPALNDGATDVSPLRG